MGSYSQATRLPDLDFTAALLHHNLRHNLLSLRNEPAVNAAVEQPKTADPAPPPSEYPPPRYSDLSIYVKQRNGTEHLAINNSLVWRALARMAAHTPSRIDGRCSPIFPISYSVTLKICFDMHLVEATTMQTRASTRRLPTRAAHMVMERVGGITLAEAVDAYSDDDLKNVFAQVRAMVDAAKTAATAGLRRAKLHRRIPAQQPHFPLPAPDGPVEDNSELSLLVA